MTKIILAIAFCLTISSLDALKCYNGYVRVGRDKDLDVRVTTCQDVQTRCTTTRAFDVIKGVTTETIKGACGSERSEEQFKLMKQLFPSRDFSKSKIETCNTDLCNDKVTKAAEIEKKRVEKMQGNRLTCTTGQLLDLPRGFPNSDIPKQNDTCFPGTKECVTLKYDFKFKMGEGQFVEFHAAQATCKSPDIKCEDYCAMTSEFVSISNCCAVCCDTDSCNANFKLVDGEDKCKL